MNDDEAIALALAEAQAAGERGEVPVGAVLLSAEGEVLARDGNPLLTASNNLAGPLLFTTTTTTSTG